MDDIIDNVVPPVDPGGRRYNLGAGIKPQAQRGADLLGHMFGIKVIGGVRPDSMPYHPSGRAIDLMCTREQGDKIAAYAKLHALDLQVDHIIWRQQIWSPQRAAEGWRSMPDRGSVSANYYDHVHITFLTGQRA